MKKILLATLCCTLLFAYQAKADTTSGKVISVDGNQITVKTKDGKHLTMQTNDHTTYRKKKVTKKYKSKRGQKSTEWGYTPIAEEDDWVDVVYNPTTEEGTIYQVQDVIVYDD